LASASSFSFSHARSSERMSIDSALAIAPSPRGCSAPLTQTSNGIGGLPLFSTWPMKIANFSLRPGTSTM
jgi:hypothetical protein